MTSKEALEEVIENISLEWGYEGIEDEIRETLKPLYKDLDRLEELEKENQELKNKNTALELWNECYAKENAKLKKALEILKNKKVNVFHIWVFDNYSQYKEHYPFSEYHAEEDMLTEQEFKFLKEVLKEC